MTSDSLQEELESIYRRRRGRIRQDLKGIRELDERLGRPSQKLRSVVIAGTNGKGSCARTLESIAQAHGLRTGLFTSPHRSRINERFRIAGESVSDGALMAALHRVDDGEATFFELSTALAFDLFQRAETDLAILEVGMGGRWDAVNICDPEVSTVVSVSLDHQEFLGSDLESIAKEKLAVARRGRPLVLGPGLTAYRALAEETGAELWLNEEHWRADLYAVESIPVIARRPEHIKLDSLWRSSATAVATASQLGLHDEKAVQRGLDDLVNPMRGERLGGLLIDAAHNQAGIEALAEHVEGPVDALVSLCGRDPELLRPFLSKVRRFYVVEAEHEKAVPAAELVRVLRGMGARCQELNRSEALGMMEAARRSEGLTLVAFGSIYGLGPLRDALLGEA